MEKMSITVSIKWAFSVAEEGNLTVKNIYFRRQKKEHLKAKKNLEHNICIERNRRKIIILSASDPWKYLVRAKKNHETDLGKNIRLFKSHLGYFCLTSGF